MVLAIGGVLAHRRLDHARRPRTGRPRSERIRHAGVAIVPEGRRLLPELTVEENLKVATYSLKGKAADAGRGPGAGALPRITEAPLDQDGLAVGR